MKQPDQIIMNSGQWLQMGIATGWIKEAAWWDKKTPAEKAYFQSKKDREQQMLGSLRYIESYANLAQQISSLLQDITDTLQSNNGMFAFLESLPNGKPLAEQMHSIEGTSRTFQTAARFLKDALQHIINTGNVPENIDTHSVQEPAQAQPAQPTEPAQPAPLEIPLYDDQAPAAPLFEEPAQPEAQPAAPLNEVTLDKLPEFLQNSQYKLVYQRPRDGKQYPVVIRRPPNADDKVILVSNPEINKGAPFPVDTKNLAVVQSR